MKKYILIPLFALVVSTLFAQHGPRPEAFREKKDKMNAMKAAYVTEELNLSTEEAQRFWPIYNEMNDKIEDLRMTTFEKIKALRNGGKNKLAQLALGKHLACIRINYFRIEIIFIDVQSMLKLKALEGNPGSDDFGEPVDVAGLNAKFILNLVAH